MFLKRRCDYWRVWRINLSGLSQGCEKQVQISEGCKAISMDRAGKVTKQFGWLARSPSGIGDRNENRLEMLQLWRQEPGHWLENEFGFLRGVSVLINRGQGTVGGGRGPVKLIQKAEPGWKRDQVEALASLGCTHGKACSYYFLTPHIYHSITCPFSLSSWYTQPLFQTKVGQG